MPRVVRVLSPAKVNLYLDVEHGRRPDGYHEIRTLFQAIDLTDEVEIKAADGPIMIECTTPGIPLGSNNLAARAAAAILTDAGIRKGVRIRLTKRIPQRGGLGGGSSNAAATLVGLRALFETGHTDGELETLAASLGADAPFFIRGGTQIGRGCGHELEKADLPLSVWFVIIKGIEGVSTAEVYAEFDRSRIKAPLSLNEALARLSRGQWDMLFNSLARPAIRLAPGIEAAMEALISIGAVSSAVCGSGACVFGVFKNEVVALQAAKELHGFEFVWVCRALDKGVEVVGLY